MERLPAARRIHERCIGWPVALLLVASLGGCGRAGGTPEEKSATLTSALVNEVEATPDPPPPAPAEVDRDAENPTAAMELLRKRGRFEEFVDATLNAAAEHGNDAGIQALKAEALLAVGASGGAESAAELAAELALDRGDSALAVQALRLWVTARFRQGRPLASVSVATLVKRLPADEPGADTIRFWCDALAERAAYVVDETANVGPVEVAPTQAALGTIWADLNAIEVRAGGATLPMVFLDTGAQHTLITLRGAKIAGILAGGGDTQLVGFAGLKAQPAVLDTLELGGLTLHNVPVMVGDSPPLVANKGQMALGTELMHHIRFTLDYPARRVLAEPAARPSSTGGGPASAIIPLWTFPQACLAHADLARGATARVLVDTGNRSGSYLSARWAQRNLPRFQRPTSSLVFKFKNQNVILDTMHLGSLELGDWPILDRIPAELERQDLFDLLVGHDLLGPYRVSIDLRQRVLRLEGSPGTPAEHP